MQRKCAGMNHIDCSWSICIVCMEQCFSVLATLKCVDFNSQNCPASNLVVEEFWELMSTYLKVAMFEKCQPRRWNSFRNRKGVERTEKDHHVLLVVMGASFSTLRASKESACALPHMFISMWTLPSHRSSGAVNITPIRVILPSCATEQHHWEEAGGNKTSVL